MKVKFIFVGEVVDEKISYNINHVISYDGLCNLQWFTKIVIILVLP